MTDTSIPSTDAADAEKLDGRSVRAKLIKETEAREAAEARVRDMEARMAALEAQLPKKPASTSVQGFNIHDQSTWPKGFHPKKRETWPWDIEVEAYGINDQSSGGVGQYYQRGEIIPRWRKSGERFLLGHEAHFTEVWMRRVVGGIAAEPRFPENGPQPGASVTTVRNEVADRTSLVLAGDRP